MLKITGMSMISNQDRAEYIRSGLRQLRMNQAIFARKCGVTPETVSRWCSGRHEVPEYALNLVRAWLTIKVASEALDRL
jgi:DNA-binding transcriptional regulator YiaG